MNTQTTIYVVRHGQAEFNVKGVIGGTLEPNFLTAKGEDQAVILAQKFKDVQLDMIYSSDLARARRTAEIFASTKNILVKTSELLRERSWGSLQGKTFKEAKKKHPEAFQRESTIEGKEAFDFRYTDDMESLKDTVARFKRFLKKITKTHQGKTILVVCHFDIMIGYLVYAKFGTYQDLMNANFDHTGYYTLICSNGDIKVGKVIGLNIH